MYGVGLQRRLCWSFRRGRLRVETLNLAPLHNRSIVRVSHHRVLRVQLLGVADHAKEAFVLLQAVDRELSVENLVATMLAVGLREHHQLDVRRVALKLREGLSQVVNFVSG